MKKLSILLLTVSIFVFSLTFAMIQLSKSNKVNSNVTTQEVFSKKSQRYAYDKFKDPATGKIPNNIRSLELNFIRNTFKLDSKKSSNTLLADSKWSNRGPFEIGGRTRAFDYDIRDENILIAGGVSSGMWKSTNAGASWTKTSKPYQIHSVSCLAQDRRPGKENIWYYGTGELLGNSAYLLGDGIYKSTNNGDSWEPLPSTISNTPNSWDKPFDYIWNIAVDNTAPINKDIIYVAAASYGIFRTTDGGTNWASVLAGNGSEFSDIAITSKGILYATLGFKSGNGGIYRSTDGLKWTKITPDGFAKNYRRIVIGIAPSDENQVYFVAETPGYGKITYDFLGKEMYHSLWKYTYKSGDGSGNGGIWEDRSENIPKPEPTRGQMNSQRSYNLVVKVKPDNPNVVFIAAVALYRSNSGFKNNDFKWIGGTCPDASCDYDYRYTNHHSDIHVLFFSPNNPNILYTGSDGGLHKTIDDMSDNVEWISLNNGYFTTQFYSVALSHGPQNSLEVLGGLQDNGTLLSRTENLDDRWTNPLRADGFRSAISDDGKFYYASQNSNWQPEVQIYRVVQDKDGINTIQTRIDPAGGKDFIWNTPYLLDPNNDNIMYVAGGKMVWRNNDLSAIPNVSNKDSTNIQWDSLSNTRIDYKEDVSPIGEVITALGISTKPANVLYYGTNTGNVYRIDNANIGNPQPIKIKGQNFPAGAYVSSIAVNPDDASKVFVSFSNYAVISIYYSENGGNQWIPVSGNLEENSNGSGSGPAVNWVSILKDNDKYIYFAGTTAGLFSTAYLNGPNTVWQMEGADEIGNVVIDMIDVRHSDKYVAIGTHGIGVLTSHYSNHLALPSATQLIAPLNSSKFIQPIVNLSWKLVPDAVFYEVQLSKDSEFKNGVIILEGIKTNNTTYNYIEQGHIKYYWRVRTVNAGGVSQFTDVWSFTSGVGAPELIYPAANENQIPINVTLKWNKVEGADKYRLQFVKGFSISEPSIDTVVYNNEFELKNLEYGKSHVWRVAAIEDEHEGLFSNTYRFVTEKSTSVSDLTIGFNAQLYPNPINMNSRLILDITKTDYTEIKIYDYNGRLIDILNNSYLNPGNYSFAIPYHKLLSGNYMIHISYGKIQKLIKFNYQK